MSKRKPLTDPNSPLALLGVFLLILALHLSIGLYIKQNDPNCTPVHKKKCEVIAFVRGQR
jgi:hypothetical protein